MAAGRRPRHRRRCVFSHNCLSGRVQNHARAGVRLKTDSSGAQLNLTGGSMQFSLASSSSLKIQNEGLSVSERSGELYSRGPLIWG